MKYDMDLIDMTSCLCGESCFSLVFLLCIGYTEQKDVNTMDRTLERLLAQSLDRGTLDPADIPDLDLYIDQIIALMQKQVGTSEDGQPPLTRTMIHNYSKAGVIRPVKGKKYSKEHIMQMFAVYSLKNTLSIAQIRRVLCALDAESEALESGYRSYIEGQQEMRENMCREMQKMLEDLHGNSREQLFTAMLLMADASQTVADFARRIAEECYPDPPAKGKKKEK